VSGFTIAKLDEIPKRDTWIPVRDHFGIQGFGVNAYRAEEAGGVVINEHTETLAKHEELYLVVEGHATFTIDGDEIDAPAGTLVFVGDPTTQRSAVANEAGTTVLIAGARPGHAFEIAPWEESWQENRQAMALAREERFSEAADLLRDAVTLHGDSAGLLYNLACFDSLAGADAATVSTNLARAIELHPDFRDLAREDTDFDPVRDDPAIQALVGEPT
jgi:quercetin dioxygenase-like cupin family protein